MTRQAERQTKRADLVLKEVVERLDEVEVHALGERDQVVVALDGGRLAARLASAGLDDVGVDGALSQILDRLAIALELLGDREELFPELRADDAALLLRLGHAGQKLGIAVLGVDVDKVDVKLLGEDLLHLLGLTLAQQTVVDEHTGHLLAHGAGASAATTEESTPPDKARITRSSPTFSRNSAVMVSTRLSMLQLGSRPQISNRKLLSSC